MTSRYPLFATHYSPFYRFAAAIDQGAFVRSLDLDLGGRCPGRALERDGVLVHRQAIMLRAVEGREGLELVERAFLLEHPGIGLERDRRIEHARHPVDGDLPGHRVGSGIGAEKVTGLA